MPIVVTCSNCQRSFRVADTLAGRRAKCGSCQTPIVIPRLASSTPTSSPRAANRPAATSRTPAAAQQKSALTGQAQAPAAPPQGATAPPADALVKQIAASFHGTYERPPTSLGYRLALAIGFVGLVLVPVGYVTAVAALGWLVCWQAQHLDGGFSLRFKVPLLIASIMALVFMLRALLLLFYRRKHVPESCPGSAETGKGGVGASEC